MSIEVGQVVPGKVVSIKPFGAFVDLGDNQSGMIHISEVADEYVKDIKDYMAIGDEIHVKVIKILDDGKINLSLKTLAGDNASRPVKQAPGPEARPQQAKSSPSQAAKKSPLSEDFDKMMSQFLKDSEERLTSLKRSTEGKRGGRGGRRG